MEFQFKDLKIGYQEKIPFSLLENDQHQHAPTFKLMSTPNKESLVLIYQWVDHRSRIFYDKEEAFYIDDVTPGNYELAEKIFLDVYYALQEAFQENPNLDFDMCSCVEGIIEKYKSKSL